MIQNIEKLLGKEVIIIEDHTDFSGVDRKVGDLAREYIGFHYNTLGSNEKPLVFENEDYFMGTNKSNFAYVKRKKE